MGRRSSLILRTPQQNLKRNLSRKLRCWALSEQKSNIRPSQVLSSKATLISRALDKPTARKYGPTEVNTKGNGLMARLVARVVFGMLTVTNMKGSGKMTKRMATAFTCTQMEQSILATGKTTCSMAMAKRPGSIAPPSKAST